MRTILLTITASFVLLLYGCRPTLTAPEFDMVDRSGKKVGVKDIASDLTLLYLNDIDCEDCHNVSDSLKNSAVINGAVRSGKMTILSVYVGENKEQWQNLEQMSGRVECIDEKMSVFCQSEYQYETFPALFLLDKRKRFIIQNASVSQLVDFLKKK